MASKATLALNADVNLPRVYLLISVVKLRIFQLNKWSGFRGVLYNTFFSVVIKYVYSYEHYVIIITDFLSFFIKLKH
ncbi:hypothetical protein GCM10011387_18170 [Pedobacter quisquiliarum]|uniref:Uncharacterized protein n=1 Tax=Pedobacter quisquiliarum TaxID=1834438 RepID=A0A916XE23_9SPHI|nr:hypothetical protein GCM10011387_18170 [Pedobacter quisquiliarum]